MTIPEREVVQRSSDIHITFPPLSPSYQLQREEVDVDAMVDHAQYSLIRRRRQAVAAFLDSRVWQEEYPSLRSLPFRRKYREFSSRVGTPVYVFEPMRGAVNVPTDQITTSPLGEFFTPLRTRHEREFTQLRGLTYYVPIDFSKDTPAKKLAVMRKDMEEGLGVVSSVDRRTLNSEDLLLYLGVLDHLKAHTLTAFNALIFHEREGIRPDDADYIRTRQDAQRLMVTTTRAYYQACFGQPFDAEFNPPLISSALERVAGYIVDSGHSIAHFTFAEISHPVIIMLGAHEAAHKKPLPDLIIGIPSGGTEVAVVTHQMYENLYPNGGANVGIPTLELVPLSFHYRTQRGISVDRLTELLRQSTSIDGKRVLIVDDNSNTGSTLQRMSEAVVRAGASEVSAHIAEIDPARVLAHSKKGNVADFGTVYTVNMNHPDLQTAMGISLTSSDDGSDLRRKHIKKFVDRAHKLEKKIASNQAVDSCESNH